MNIAYLGNVLRHFLKNNIAVRNGGLMYILRIISYILVIIGAINWGLIGFFGYDLVASIFGEMSLLSRIVYSLVGVSAIILLFVNWDIFFNSDI